MQTNEGLLHINHRLIEERAAAAANKEEEEDEEKQQQRDEIIINAKDVIIRIGQGLYAHKPTLRTSGVTWSTEEYSHAGLQRMYLRMKSIQRFTEVWCLLERCDMLGVFDSIFDNNGNNNKDTDESSGGADSSKKTIRIAAVGGGPGYELLATQLYFANKKHHAPLHNIQLELICMDICPAWEPYVNQLGFKFVQYDINNEEGITPLQACGLKAGELHFCIVSCVMIYVTNERVLNMFHRLVQQPHNDEEDDGNGGVNPILVSERGERTKACTMMEELGCNVIRLIDQTNGMDERQAIWCTHEFLGTNDKRQLGRETPQCSIINPKYSYEDHQKESVFPNVPYCEHKGRRRRDGGGGGRYGGH